MDSESKDTFEPFSYATSEMRLITLGEPKGQKLRASERWKLKPMYKWNTIPWRKLEKNVFKIQKRIYRASSCDDVRLVRKLQKLLINSWSAKAIAVRRVTQDNQGRKTAGVDGIKMERNCFPPLKAHRKVES